MIIDIGPNLMTLLCPSAGGSILSRFIVGRKYQSPRSQVVVCTNVRGNFVEFRWPSGSTYQFLIDQVRGYKEVPMEKEADFKVGDTVRYNRLAPTMSNAERIVKSIDGDKIWHEGGFAYANTLELVKRANDTFIVGQKYKDTRSKDSTMIVLAVSPADPTRFYVEYLNTPHLSGSVFLSDAHKWEIYKEPIKSVRYFNLYDTGGISCGFADRINADVSADTVLLRKRIACKRVEFVEGEFDE